MIIIFINSDLEGGTSSGFSTAVINFLIQVVRLFGESGIVTKLISLFKSDGFHVLLRKTAHFIEFGLLGMLYVAGLGIFKSFRIAYFKRGLTALVFAIIYAIFDELHQLFVDGRVCSIVDMAIDSFGAIIGISYLIGIIIKTNKE